MLPEIQVVGENWRLADARRDEWAQARTPMLPENFFCMKKILFVDDEPNILSALTRSQRNEPYEVLSASCPEEALEILARESVDVVISDEQMPGMPGSEFLAMVARLYPETIRIILTGEGSLNSAIRSINEGSIYRFLRKPCHTIDLTLTIHQALEHRELVVMSQKLLKENKQQSIILQNLEKEHPGILNLKKDDDGTLLLD